MRVWLIAILALTLGPLASDGTAQSQQPGDPWQFPALTQRKAFQRWWWDFQQRAYPLSDIPENAKQRALEEITQFRAGQPPPSQPVQGTGWVNIGPAPILGGQIGVTGKTRPMSGRVAAIAVDPSDANHWFIGAAQGGIWETRNAGVTWSPKTDAQASLAIGAIAFAPSKPSIIYVGTGESVFSGDAYAGAGLLKSTDGGTTWQLLATSTFAKTSFSDLKVHPTNPDIVLAATTHGSFGRGADPLPSSLVKARGIFKSTDGGATWSQKLNGTATDLEVDPTNFNRQYAGLGNMFGSASNGVYRSTDAGETGALISGPWSTMTGGVGRIELAIAPSTPDVLYVSIQDAFDTAGHDGGLLGLWRTDNAWASTPSWTRIPTGATDNGSGIHGYCGWDAAFIADAHQCWYDHDILVDPTNPAILYAGGIPLWKCTNCGGSPIWAEVSQQASNPTKGIHVDQHHMAWAGSRLIVGNDGGVWSTSDGGSTWADHNTTLAITQFYDGSIHPTNPNFALGGAQDNGTARWDGGIAWQWIGGGDGAASAISSSNPNTHWAISAQNLSILRTKDGGTTFNPADSGIDKTGVPFIARFQKCPSNDDVFIAGTDNLWKSTNFFSADKPSWSSNGPEMGSDITALAFAPSDTTCRTYAFATRSGQLRRTSDGGSTWVDIDASNTVPNRYVTDLVFLPTNANTLYVTLSGFDEGTPNQPGHVFKTTIPLFGSPVWSNVTPPVNIPHNAIALDPFDPSIVYVGTDLGVWKSTNGGSTWTHMGPEVGMPNVAVFNLQINHTTGRLIAFTHGRSALVLGAASEQFTLTLSKTGAGSGTVSSNPTGIDCGSTCSASFASGTAVTLTATPAAGSRFTGWSGGSCSGIDPCTVTINSATTVTATFALQFSLTVSKAGTASGTVTSSPAGIDCGNTCSAFFASGTVVTLTAAPAAASAFAGWTGGGCTGTGSCTVTLTAATSVTATFNVQAFTLTVTRAGSGSGAVTSNPTGINCGSACSATFASATAVTLTATSATGSTFVGWSGGGCTGTSTCVVTLSAATTVTAIFNVPGITLTVIKAGSGSGAVTSSPVGIDCGSACSVLVPNATAVTLTATPAARSTFAGWAGGGCSGTGTCAVTLSASTTVTATFNTQIPTLTVARVASGSGTVTSSPAGIDCGSACSASFTSGTTVTLMATPAAGSTFEGWSGGGCTGTRTSTCAVTLSATTTVSAIFSLPLPLTCDIQMSQASYGIGETVTAGVLRIANPSATAVSIEIGIWVEMPGLSPISSVPLGLGADGKIVLPAVFDRDLGRIPLFPVTAASPRGAHTFNCRLVAPVTGELLAEDLNPFEIR